MRIRWKINNMALAIEDNGTYSYIVDGAVVENSENWRIINNLFFEIAQRKSEKWFEERERLEERSHGRESDMCDGGSPGRCPPAVGSDCR